jgi:hypothetical protein
MTRIRYMREWLRRRGLRRWYKEIALAVVLTVAALAFMAAALLRGQDVQPDDLPYATARKPPQN